MTVTIEEAKACLDTLISQLPANEDLVICDNGHPVAKLSRLEKKSWPSQPGSAKHLDHWMAPDFNAPLEDFREYME